MIDWRFIALIVILTLGVIDLVLTYWYVHAYKQWQPNKPYKLIEKNPLLTFLWSKFGLQLGMIIGAVIILALQYIVTKEAHWGFVLLLFCVLVWVMFNHATNIGLLNQLIEKYPSGYLPEAIFGVVAGNQPASFDIVNGGVK